MHKRMTLLLDSDCWARSMMPMMTDALTYDMTYDTTYGLHAVHDMMTDD